MTGFDLGSSVRTDSLTCPGLFELLVFYDGVRPLSSYGKPLGLRVGFDGDRAGKAQQSHKPAS